MAEVRPKLNNQRRSMFQEVFATRSYGFQGRSHGRSYCKPLKSNVVGLLSVDMNYARQRLPLCWCVACCIRRHVASKGVIDGDTSCAVVILCRSVHM